MGQEFFEKDPSATQLRDEVQRVADFRRLEHTMNQERWRHLDRILDQLPFRPPYQYKSLLEDTPYPEPFEEDVSYWSSGLDDAGHWFEIEWIRLRPRYLKHQGRLVAPEMIDCADTLRAALVDAGIPFAEEAGDFRIACYEESSVSS